MNGMDEVMEKLFTGCRAGQSGSADELPEMPAIWHREATVYTTLLLRAMIFGKSKETSETFTAYFEE